MPRAGGGVVVVVVVVVVLSFLFSGTGEKRTLTWFVGDVDGCNFAFFGDPTLKKSVGSFITLTLDGEESVVGILVVGIPVEEERRGKANECCFSIFLGMFLCGDLFGDVELLLFKMWGFEEEMGERGGKGLAFGDKEGEGLLF